MSECLADYLTAVRADRDGIQQGLRLYLGERTGDLTDEEMAAAVKEQISAKDWEELVSALCADSALAEAACLAALSAEWEDPARRPVIRAALENSKAKLPLLEAGILATVIMYGMYLATTGGKAKRTVTTRTSDGAFRTEEVEYASPAAWLGTLRALLGRK